MTHYLHGGDSYGYENILDLSINLHPFGMPEEIISALKDTIEDISAYPDPHCRDLKKAISQRDKVDFHQIICGNGAADLIYRLIQSIRPKKALLTAPTFAAYETALNSINCNISYHNLLPEEDFILTELFLNHITTELDIVFLCTPNNPTAQPISPILMEKIAKKCEECACYLVIDECFLELSHRPHSFHYLLENHFVFLLRAFTKSYALAGLRLGYGLSQNSELLQSLELVAQPWSVSILAQKAGVIACSLPNWTELGRKELIIQQKVLIEGLQRLHCKVWNGTANFLLFQLKDFFHLQESLLKKGILIRDCSNYRGLGRDFYRISITNEKNSLLFLKKLEEVLS